MATNVIKRNGSKEPFEAEKIKSSIRQAATEAGVAAERIDAIVMQASQAAMDAAQNVEEIETSVLRDKVLAALDALEPSISEAWRNYDTEHNKM